MQFIFEKPTNAIVDVAIAPDVVKIWEKYRQISKTHTEACGVLIGGYNSINKKIIVETCTTPMTGDIRKRYSFILKDKGHQSAVDMAFKKSNGKSFYLGTWHSHPAARPHPSHRDLMDWKKCMARNPLHPCFLFSIVGTNHTYIRTQLMTVSNEN